MGYCKPGASFLKQRKSSNLGSKLQGGGSTLLHYTFEAKHIEACQKLCLKTLNKGDVNKFRDAIAQEYRVHWQLDSLPLIMRSEEVSFASVPFSSCVGLTPAFPPCSSPTRSEDFRLASSRLRP